ncbi:MAG TPA: hypothetical protein VG650_00815 [Mycobacteriales bacterium]|nr:hypothetical protein [Mycobacteriales bacterium]
MRPRTLLVPVTIGLAAVVGFSGPGLVSASAHGAATAGSCGPAHRYVDAESAVAKAHAVVIHGKHATLHCGGPDDYSYVIGKAVTLRMLMTGTVVVWKMPEDPSQGTRTIPATNLPHWLKRNAGEPIYKIHGPSNAVMKLVEKWHP